MIAFVAVAALLTFFILFGDAWSGRAPRESETEPQPVAHAGARPSNHDMAAEGSTTNPSLHRFKAGRRCARRGITAIMLLAGAGCAHGPAWSHEAVSRPNMIFHDRGVFVYGPRQNAQLEPGAAGSSGATVAGCTSCK
ncbi:MAG: hypothetical protein Q7S40_14580 [Opitutaceae bacterium]|nr:hypothetical protein [Opitutaceae bacterium]